METIAATTKTVSPRVAAVLVVGAIGAYVVGVIFSSSWLRLARTNIPFSCSDGKHHPADVYPGAFASVPSSKNTLLRNERGAGIAQTALRGNDDASSPRQRRPSEHSRPEENSFSSLHRTSALHPLHRKTAPVASVDLAAAPEHDLRFWGKRKEKPCHVRDTPEVGGSGDRVCSYVFRGSGCTEVSIDGVSFLGDFAFPVFPEILPPTVEGEMGMTNSRRQTFLRDFTKCTSRPRYYLTRQPPFGSAEAPFPVLYAGPDTGWDFIGDLLAELGTPGAPYHLEKLPSLWNENRHNHDGEAENHGKLGPMVVGGVTGPTVDNSITADGQRDRKARRGRRRRLVVDIGGNIGLFAIAVCRLVPDARILTLEPHPVNFRFLVNNVKRAGCADHVRAVNKGVSADGRRLKLRWQGSVGTSAFFPEGSSRMDSLVGAGEELLVPTLSPAQVMEAAADWAAAGSKTRWSSAIKVHDTVTTRHTL